MNAKAVLYFFEILRVTGLDRRLRELRACVLGDQALRSHARAFEEYRHLSFKRMLLAKGFKRVESIDVNGWDESIVLDLAEPIERGDLLGSFDVTLNSGTSEHVMSNQWRVFKNIHDMTAPDGLMLHIVPFEARGHGFWHYNEPFFAWLAKACGYSVVDMRITLTTYSYNPNKHYTFTTLRRNGTSGFVEERKWRDPPRDQLGFERFGKDYEDFMRKNLGRASNG